MNGFARLVFFKKYGESSEVISIQDGQMRFGKKHGKYRIFQAKPNEQEAACTLGLYKEDTV